jgi:hypothetical protein
LIWRPESLPVIGDWNPDGPMLPVEFARHSEGDRVTLVLLPPDIAASSQVYWAELRADSVAEAREALRARERVQSDRIGMWSPGVKYTAPCADIVAAWAGSKHFDGVVWTTLGPKWNDTNGQIPTVAEVVAFLRGRLPGSSAEEYVRKAPRQVRTPYRERIEQELGWSCTSAV